jgi:Ran GTPase-activating protein (RanGAP) involved in mRNA processing and transport
MLKAQKFLDEENVSYRRHRSPKKREKLYVSSTVDHSLPRPLSPGLAFAATVADFDELAARRVWDLPLEQRCTLTQEHVERIFRAKCADQKCPVSFDRAQRFTELISEQCKGEWFVLRQCGLGLHTLRAIVDVLAEDRTVTHLDLSGNTFGPDAGLPLSDLLQRNTTLVVLRIQSINIGDGIAPLMGALHRNEHLTALDLSGIAGITRNTIWGEAAASVAKMLETNQLLSIFNLAHCGLQRAAIPIIRACTQHVALSRINLSGNKIKDEGCKAVALLLSHGTCLLQSLSLEENGITCVGATAIGDALKLQDSTTASNLEALYLGMNHIGSRGLEEISHAAKEHQKLRFLSLSFNVLTSMGFDEDGYRLPDSTAGLAALFDALETSALRVLKLSNSNIATLPQNIVGSLQRTRKLEMLDISENRFGDPGGKLLAEGLTKNRSLVHLSFTQCGMTTSAMRDIAAAIKNHQTIRHLQLNQGTWDVHGSGILDAIKANHVILSVDLGKDGMDAVRGALQRNKLEKVANATPQLEEQQKALAREEKELQETREQIVDEVRRREKLQEQFKVLREKQKTLSQQMKQELEELKGAVEREANQLEALQNQHMSAEDGFNRKLRECESEKGKMERRIENVVQQRVEAIGKTEKLLKQLNTPQEDKELKQLETELSISVRIRDEEHETLEIVQAKLKAIEDHIAAYGKQ